MAPIAPADGDVCAHRRRLVVLHPGREVEKVGQQQVDEGNQHWEGEQAGLTSQGVVDGMTSTLLEVLSRREYE